MIQSFGNVVVHVDSVLQLYTPDNSVLSTLFSCAFNRIRIGPGNSLILCVCMHAIVVRRVDSQYKILENITGWLEGMTTTLWIWFLFSIQWSGGCRNWMAYFFFCVLCSAPPRIAMAVCLRRTRNSISAEMIAEHNCWVCTIPYRLYSNHRPLSGMCAHDDFTNTDMEVWIKSYTTAPCSPTSGVLASSFLILIMPPISSKPLNRADQLYFVPMCNKFHLFAKSIIYQRTMCSNL